MRHDTQGGSPSHTNSGHASPSLSHGHGVPVTDAVQAVHHPTTQPYKPQAPMKDPTRNNRVPPPPRNPSPDPEEVSCCLADCCCCYRICKQEIRRGLGIHPGPTGNYVAP